MGVYRACAKIVNILEKTSILRKIKNTCSMCIIMSHTQRIFNSTFCSKSKKLEVYLDSSSTVEATDWKHIEG